MLYSSYVEVLILKQLVLILLLILVFGYVQASDITTSQYASVKLSPEEKAFLQKHSTIKVHMEVGCAPFSYIENDRFVGYSIEYADLIAKFLGVKFEYKKTYHGIKLLKV